MSGSAITPFAWIFMLTSMGAVTALGVYCYYRILFGKDSSRGSPEEDGAKPGVMDDAPPGSGSAPPSP